MAERFAKIARSNKVTAMFTTLTLGKEKCNRCDRTVYATEREKSSKGDLFHKQCFSCSVCRQKLTIGTAKTSPNGGDSEIYCAHHVPALGTATIGPDAIAMLRLRELKNMKKKMDKKSTIRAAKFGSDSKLISGAIASQTLLRDKKGQTNNSQHHFPAFLGTAQDSYQEDLRLRQEKLEREQKEEEDRLYRKFEEERREAQKEAEKESTEEWEGKLKSIVAMLEKQFAGEETTGTQMRAQKRSQMEDSARVELEKKRAQLVKNKTYRVIAKQQVETSELVGKHSAEMLDLIKDEKKKLEVTLHNEFAEAKAQGLMEDMGMGDESLNIEEVVTEMIGTTEAPAPRPPRLKRADIMPSNEDDEEFDKLFDKHVAQVAETEQTTFTELVHVLTGPFMSDLAKARAIYRWITYKDLNAIQFSEAMNDTPFGLLRGIKYGTETYHTLFKRLCSYAGLHCTEINGKSKSVGFEPGMKFDGTTFKNSWNAVLIEKEWHLVQCNWGARYLVINKDEEGAKKPAPSDGKSGKDDKIKYQYDEHYFLTDPEEFIQEFWPLDKKWQLLEQPVTLREFENMPLIRSIFFHLGLQFKEAYPAVLTASDAGGVDIRIVVPQDIANEVAFLYQLRYANKSMAHETEYCGAKLERFVFQSMSENEVIYSVYVPNIGEYFLQIFASRVQTAAQAGGGSMEGYKLKAVCKFKIVCTEMQDKMFPLPNCAPGEWGPRKALRHFHLTPVSHPVGVIQCDEGQLKVEFAAGAALQYLAKLRMNEVSDNVFDDYVTLDYGDDYLTVVVNFPVAGQYGLDLYAKPLDAPQNQPLAHACKYLINVGEMEHEQDLSYATLDYTLQRCMGKWGEQPDNQYLNLRPVSHPNWKVKTGELNTTITLHVPADVIVSFHFAREPDEDWREHVALARHEEETVTLQLKNIHKSGNYLLALFGRKDTDESVKIFNGFNYYIKSTYGR